MDNRVSAKLSQADKDAVLTAIKTIKDKLPFLIDLTTDERRALPKLGDKSRAFVVKALEVATQNPTFLPRSFDLEEMRMDVELFEEMYPILLGMAQLNELIEDTAMEVMDNINAKFGRHTLKLASAGVKQSWFTKSDRRSPRYTTCWNELLTVS